jgi:hypothetical protein
MNSLTATYIILGVAAAIGLSLFAVWIFAPAWTSYGRAWERLAAAILSIFVLFAFVSVGIGAGLLITLHWDKITGIFG